jgi:amino acid permease
MIQLAYIFALIMSSGLQMVPVFKLMVKSRLYQKIPYKDSHPFLVQYIFRCLVMIFYTGLGYFIPNLGQLLNLQGAFTGTFIAFVFPILFYFRVFGYQISEAERTFYTILLIVGITGGIISSLTAANALLFGKEDNL